MSRVTQASNRNIQVSHILSNMFDEIEQGNIQADPTLQQQIEVLFQTSSWGFREITLVICIARLLDKNYRASQDFYACTPRSLYEKPIRDELEKRGIPNHQSGPLNVAKATKKIDYQWAIARKPPHVAEQVVRLVEQIEKMNQTELEGFTRLLLSRFLQERKIIQQLSVKIDPNADAVQLYSLCRFLIDNVPDGGNTPQRIVGYLLECYHEELHTGIVIDGHTDRAFTTSTTSKKLGDITEQQIGGLILSAYEVTVKKFGEQRVREAYEAAHSYLETTKDTSNSQEIIVICRPKDVHPDVKPISHTYLGRLDYQDMVFHFIDIYEWIMGQLIRMTPDARVLFFIKLHQYVDDKNTSAKVKQAWASWYESQSAS